LCVKLRNSTASSEVCDPNYEDGYEIRLLEFLDLGHSIGQRLPYGKCKDPIGCSMLAMRGLNVLEEL
jgi:hypothetical protein